MLVLCRSQENQKQEGKMKLNIKALVLTAGILWALAVFLTGVANLIWPEYGVAFLKIMASVYPGYHATRSIGDVIVGTLYGLIDGAICALFFGWLYNVFVGKKTK
jgi:ABC-type nitrate/sulfonate/bicarbonate transport system permease component